MKIHFHQESSSNKTKDRPCRSILPTNSESDGLTFGKKSGKSEQRGVHVMESCLVFVEIPTAVDVFPFSTRTL